MAADIESLIKKRQALVEKGVDQLKAKTIGQHVLSLMERDGELSAAALIESLRHANSSPADEADRLLTEAAMACLQELQGRRG